MKLARMALVGLLASATAWSAQSTHRPASLEGAWRLVAMQLISADGTRTTVPTHESLVIFAEGYYSIAYAFGRDSAVGYAQRWHPSDGEKVARFSSMIVNAGSYRTRGSRIDACPLFALAPEFIGGEGVFSYSFTADTLDLTWERSIARDGLEYPSRGTVTLLRLVRARTAGAPAK